MEWFLKVVRDNYANFNGRARRKEYWMFVLFSFIIQLVIMVIDNLLGFKPTTETVPGFEWLSYLETGYLGYIYILAIFIPSLAVIVRRFHDTGKSGWNLLWYFTCIGIFYQLYLLILEGDHGPNEYGNDPKEEENQDPFAGQRDAHTPYSNPNNPFTNDNI